MLAVMLSSNQWNQLYFVVPISESLSHYVITLSKHQNLRALIDSLSPKNIRGKTQTYKQLLFFYFLDGKSELLLRAAAQFLQVELEFDKKYS